MIRISNTVVGILNLLSLLVGLAAIGYSLYIHLDIGGNATDCQRVIKFPLLIGGGAIFIVSLLGLFGSFCGKNAALYVYLFLMFVLIIGLVAFTVFVLLVTNRNVGKKVSEKGIKEYKIGDFSHWLQKYVLNDKKWNDIKSCLIDAHVCRGFVLQQNVSAIYNKLSITQSGCCKPPVYCGFTSKNATYWIVPKTGPAVEDSDCTTWSNNQKELCFDCKSCKGEVLVNIRQQWRNLAIINSCVLIFVTLVYIIGCFATRNNDYSSHKYKRYRGYP
ncbi:Tetraspanin family protein [Quillaja saponaria]|uniref:Tetraspanin family protein n=1 Tax=Quillaja saponaria TaxID=32244 RepID=A0AAD7QC52_QUISA|nr:Tetraspanin family protein [Quillaja saponaria]